jgi:ferrous iron transport protein B
MEIKEGMKILLMGNPNVGKSVVFNRLTGARVVTANYAGTTVEYTRGSMFYQGKRLDVIDVPGTYSLQPTCKAEEVAVEMLASGDLIVNVVDATNLERNLRFSLELMAQGKPMILLLNFWDEARHKGIEIDVAKLEEILQVPVIPTVAVTAEGIKPFISRLPQAIVPPDLFGRTSDELWQNVGKIIAQVQHVTHRHHTWLERLEDISIKPLTGLPLAAVIILMNFALIRFIGENLIGYVFDPFFQTVYRPLIDKAVTSAFSSGLIHDLLLGTSADFVESMGLLTTGIYVPIAMVLPYIFSFYLVLGFFEDFGYLPRFATLLDTYMHRIGLHGFAIIPIILGLGCNVPGALATRVLESRRERFIAGTLYGANGYDHRPGGPLRLTLSGHHLRHSLSHRNHFGSYNEQADSRLQPGDLSGNPGLSCSPPGNPDEKALDADSRIPAGSHPFGVTRHIVHKYALPDRSYRHHCRGFDADRGKHHGAAQRSGFLLDHRVFA